MEGLLPPILGFQVFFVAEVLSPTLLISPQGLPQRHVLYTSISTPLDSLPSLHTRAVTNQKQEVKLAKKRELKST